FYVLVCIVLCLISISLFFCFLYSPPCLFLHSFPTRRSSDLCSAPGTSNWFELFLLLFGMFFTSLVPFMMHTKEVYHTLFYLVVVDRKSTRLNSSHVSISYAVFCLKKKM